MAEVPLSRAEFLLRVARQARGFAAALREGEPAYRLALAEIGPEPVMRMPGGRSVYAWREGDALQVRSGNCPHDGLSLYYRATSDGPRFLCPACGFLSPAELTALPFRLEGEALLLLAP